MRAVIFLSSLLVSLAGPVSLWGAEPSWSRPTSSIGASGSSTSGRISSARSRGQLPASLTLVDWVSPASFPWPDDFGDLKQPGAGDDEPKVNYGPPANEPRKTLMQWSYGTTFSGGPPVEDSLQTDRPDFVEASTTVGKGVLQIESGYTYIRNNDPGDVSTTHSIGEVLFRYGVIEDWLELRLGVFPFSQTQSVPAPATTNRGLDDLYLGVKLGLTPQEGWLPEMALVPQMTVPTGHDSVSADHVLAGMNWLYGWDVTDFIAIGASTQFNSAVDGETLRRYTEWAQAITINYNLTDDVGAYTEWFCFVPSGATSERVQHYMDGGITYRPTPDMQFDVRAGFGLTGASDDFFIGTGYSIRIK